MGKRRRRGRQRLMWVASSDLPRSAWPSVLRAPEWCPRRGRLRRLCRGAVQPSSMPTGSAVRVWRRAAIFGCCCSATSKASDSERAIAWRVADSLSLRQFLDVALARSTAGPLDGVAHAATDRRRDATGRSSPGCCSGWPMRAWFGGKTVGIDATTLEANAGLAQHRTAGYGRGLRDVPAPTGGGLGHRHADARRAGPDGPQAPEEGVQRRLDAS